MKHTSDACKAVRYRAAITYIYHPQRPGQVVRTNPDSMAHRIPRGAGSVVHVCLIYTMETITLSHLSLQQVKVFQKKKTDCVLCG